MGYSRVLWKTRYPIASTPTQIMNGYQFGSLGIFETNLTVSSTGITPVRKTNPIFRSEARKRCVDNNINSKRYIFIYIPVTLKLNKGLCIYIYIYAYIYIYVRRLTRNNFRYTRVRIEVKSYSPHSSIFSLCWLQRK